MKEAHTNAIDSLIRTANVIAQTPWKHRAVDQPHKSIIPLAPPPSGPLGLGLHSPAVPVLHKIAPAWDPQNQDQTRAFPAKQ